MLRVLFISIASLLICNCTSIQSDFDGLTPDSRHHHTDELTQGLVSAANPLAVQAGVDILKQGGNAIDAAIAIQSTLGLVELQSSGLAGGAFLLFYHAKTDQLMVFDGREKAPVNISKHAFLDQDGKPLPFMKAVYNGNSVGTPGVIAMLNLAHQKYGALDWADTFHSTIELSKNGFLVSPRLHHLITTYLVPDKIEKSKAIRDYLLTKQGKALPIGYRLKNKAYAKTLERIAENPGNFYHGKIAEEIIENVKHAPMPGSLSLEDLSSYQAKIRNPVCASYRGYQICSSPPPASGGIFLNEMLEILENTEFSKFGPDDLMSWHYFIEAAKLAYADRDAYVADPQFIHVPVNALLDKTYLKERAKQIRKDQIIQNVTAGTPTHIRPAKDQTLELGGTSHFVVIDFEGNIVSMTTSVEFIFGSKRMAGGMILNNQLTDFSFKSKDAKGKPIINSIAPEKRPRSSMSPTLIFDKNHDFFMAIGSPGGNSIPSYVAKTIIGVIDWGLSLEEAIELPNIVARGQTVKIETSRFNSNLLKELEEMGHHIRKMSGEGSGLHGAYKSKQGKITGMADPRREGIVAYIDP